MLRFSGLGLLACGKILGVDLDVVPEQTANTSEGIGLTSAGGTGDTNRLHGNSVSTVSGTGDERDDPEASGGQGGVANADAETDANAGEASGVAETDDSSASTDIGSTASTSGSGGQTSSETSNGGGSETNGGGSETSNGGGGQTSGYSATDASGGSDGYNATTGGGGDIGESARCSPTATFTSIDPVRGISGAAALAHYSHDELTVYYADATGSTLRIAKATRPTIDSPFGAAELLAPLNQLGFVANPSLTADGLTLYLDSNATGEFHIYSARRDTLDQAFPVPAMVSELVSDPGPDGGPSISASGDDIYFHSSRNGNSELFRATRTAFGFQDVEELPVSSDDYFESFPAISPDNLTLYFLRHPVSAPSGSNTTLWRSVRSNATESFSEAEPVTELDSPEVPVAEIADWISTDNCRFYFSRMPADVLWPGSSLFVATRAPEEP